MAVKEINGKCNDAWGVFRSNFSRVPEDFMGGMELTREIYKEMGCVLEKFGVRWRNYDEIQKLLDADGGE